MVLHYRPGSADGLGSLLERTEKLLEPFPCRRPPVFTPWFPAATDRRPPIRPSKPAPVITSADDLLKPADERHPPAKHKDGDRHGFPVTLSPAKRSWSVFTQTRVHQQSSPSLSRRFRHMVSVHGLHLRQRAKWVIDEHNCGSGRDVEEVSGRGPEAFSFKRSVFVVVD